MSHYAPRQPTSQGGPASAQEESEALKKSPWIHAWSDPVAGVCSYAGCMKVADLDDDGEHKLIVADSVNKKLKIYKGTNLYYETPLSDNPAAVEYFYSGPKKPCTFSPPQHHCSNPICRSRLRARGLHLPQVQAVLPLRPARHPHERPGKDHLEANALWGAHHPRRLQNATDTANRQYPRSHSANPW